MPVFVIIWGPHTSFTMLTTTTQFPIDEDDRNFTISLNERCFRFLISMHIYCCIWTRDLLWFRNHHFIIFWVSRTVFSETKYKDTVLEKFLTSSIYFKTYFMHCFVLKCVSSICLRFKTKQSQHSGSWIIFLQNWRN